MIERNTSTINQLSDDRSDVVGFGRLLRNEKVQPARIIDSLTKSVNEFADGRHVLVINDTTELNYHIILMRFLLRRNYPYAANVVKKTF